MRSVQMLRAQVEYLRRSYEEKFGSPLAEDDAVRWIGEELKRRRDQLYKSFFTHLEGAELYDCVRLIEGSPVPREEAARAAFKFKEENKVEVEVEQKKQKAKRKSNAKGRAKGRAKGKAKDKAQRAIQVQA